MVTDPEGKSLTSILSRQALLGGRLCWQVGHALWCNPLSRLGGLI